MGKLIELLAKFEFSSYVEVIQKIVGSDGNRIMIGENLYLQFDFEYLGFTVSEESGYRPQLVCPVKGCPLYTGGGHVCSEHFVEVEMRSLMETLPYFTPLRKKLALIDETSPLDKYPRMLFKEGVITSEDIGKLLAELTKNGSLALPLAETACSDDEAEDKELEFQSEELGVHVVRSPTYSRSFTVSTLDGLLQFHTCADPECTKVGVMRSGVEYFCPHHHVPAPNNSRVLTMSEMRMTVCCAWKKANPGIKLSEFKDSADFWINMLRMIREKGTTGYTRTFGKSGGRITLFLSNYMQLNYKSRAGGRRMYICSQPFCLHSSVTKDVVSDWRQYMCKHHADPRLEIVDPHLVITDPHENWMN